jgi:hypothetical protein
VHSHRAEGGEVKLSDGGAEEHAMRIEARDGANGAYDEPDAKRSGDDDRGLAPREVPSSDGCNDCDERHGEHLAARWNRCEVATGRAAGEQGQQHVADGRHPAGAREGDGDEPPPRCGGGEGRSPMWADDEDECHPSHDRQRSDGTHHRLGKRRPLPPRSEPSDAGTGDGGDS